MDQGGTSLTVTLLSLMDQGGTSLTVTLLSLTVQVDQGGTSLTVSYFSTGGITWSSVSITTSSPLLAPSIASVLPPSGAASFRRRLLQTPTRASGGGPFVGGMPATGPLTSRGGPPTVSSPQPAARRPHGLRSLLQASGATCAPTITRCATRVLPPLGDFALLLLLVDV